jgi:hypothetical protein
MQWSSPDFFVGNDVAPGRLPQYGRDSTTSAFENVPTCRAERSRWVAVDHSGQAKEFDFMARKEMSMHRKIIYPLAGAALLLSTGLATAQMKQETTPATPAAKPERATPPAKPESAMPSHEAKVTLTEEQAKTWIDKPIYSSDGKEIGEVVAFKRGADNTVLELHADIGGLLGLGETRVKVSPQQFKLQNDRVVLDMTEAQAKDLPKVES